MVDYNCQHAMPSGKGIQCAILSAVAGKPHIHRVEHCLLCTNNEQCRSRVPRSGVDPAITIIGGAAKIEITPSNKSDTASGRWNGPEIWGPKLWAELHKAALLGELSEQWVVTGWLEKMPVGCDCKNKAKAIIQASPPLRIEDQFVWAWAFHNAVNRSLSKPEITLAEAERIWK